MTTTPARIGLIRPVIDAVLSQAVPVDHLEINVPYTSVRTGEAYVLPDWLDGMHRVAVHRTEDYGPITKVAPTLLRHVGDPCTHIWSVDDDCAYPANQLALLCQVHAPDRPRILTRYGGQMQPDGTVQWWWGEGQVTMFEGFGGVLYPPGCVGDDFRSYLEATSANADCRKNDDIVLAMYFTARGVPIYLHNRPTDDVPYMVQGWLPHSKQDALSQHGHEDNYRRIFAFIREGRLLSGI